MPNDLIEDKNQDRIRGCARFEGGNIEGENRVGENAEMLACITPARARQRIQNQYIFIERRDKIAGDRKDCQGHGVRIWKFMVHISSIKQVENPITRSGICVHKIDAMWECVGVVLIYL